VRNQRSISHYIWEVSFSFYQLPYYIDGDVKLSQTFAILKYLGRKHGLIAKNEVEQIRVDLIEAEALDMRSRWVALCYGPNFVSKIFFGEFQMEVKLF
jgi:glutathione S-transferase